MENSSNLSDGILYIELPFNEICATKGPARLMALESSLRALQMEYQAWLDSLPETLEGSVQAEMLGETIEQLDTIAELLGEVQPPLGFGRD